MKPGIRDFLNLSFSPNGDYLGAGDEEGVTLWCTARGQCLDRTPYTTASSQDASFDRISREVEFATHQEGWHILIHSREGAELRPLRVLSSSLSPTLEIGPALQEASQAGLGSLALARNDRLIVAAHRTSLLVFPPEGKPFFRMETGKHYTSLEVSPNGRWAAGTPSPQHYENSRPDVWALQPSGEQVDHDFEALSEGATFGFTPDSRWLVSRKNGRLLFRSAEYSKRQWELSLDAPEGSQDSQPFVFSPNGALLAVAVSPGIIRLYSVSGTAIPRFHPVASLQSPDRLPIRALSFDQPAAQLAAIVQGRRIQLWNLRGLAKHLRDMKLNKGFPSFPPDPH
jgi:WD40 repeat protein